MDKQSLAGNSGKQLLQTPKGFRDFLPSEAKKRQYAINIIKKTFETFGFDPLETPALEYAEVLLGKYGEDADKLVFKFEDNGGRKLGMRYDQTVPTARILSMYNQNLPMPWRRYQIQSVWRAENTQAGRYREFLQCDADIYGSPSPIADSEIVACANNLFENLGFKNFTIFINDRKILFDLMNFASIPENLHLAVISEIDKLDRKTQDDVSVSLLKLGLPQLSIDHLFHHLEEALPSERLSQVIDLSQNLGVPADRLKFQARLARGLDYYTGTIFEIKVKEYEAGSVLGGGRYDNLIGKLSGTEIPAIGFALGFDRTLEAMEKLNLFLPEKARSGVLVSIFSQELVNASLEVAANLRTNNISAEIFPSESAKLDKQIKYADKKGIKWLIVIGPDEFEKDSVILKDLETGHQEELKLDHLLKKLKS